MSEESSDFIRNKEQKIVPSETETQENPQDKKDIDVRDFAEETHGKSQDSSPAHTTEFEAAYKDFEGVDGLEDAEDFDEEEVDKTAALNSLDDSQTDVSKSAGVEKTAAFSSVNAEYVASPDNLGAKHEISQKPQKKKSKHIFLKICAVIIVLLIVCAGVLVVDDTMRIKHVPENTTLDGDKDISSLTSDELRHVLDVRIEQDKANYLTLDVDGENVKIKMNALGTPNAQKTIDAAFAPYDESIFVRIQERIESFFSDQTNSYDINTIYDIDTKKVKKRVKKIAQDVDVEAVQAKYEYDAKSGGLKKTQPQDGFKLNVKKTVQAIEDAYDSSKSNFTVQAVCKVTKPQSEDLNQAILVDTSACSLRFYVGQKVVYNWPCTPGKSGYSTPAGSFYVSGKQYMPTWINPHSSWSESMAETIGPGPNNPLGLRALEISCGGGIYIHGTTNTGQLGSQGSHGCIRLSNDNVCKLYDKVKLNCPVIIR